MISRPILLVEDNPDDAELTARAFRKNNIANELIVAPDGESALEYLCGTGKWADQGPQLPQAILLDLKLPRMDGLEVLRRIRENERTRFLPVIVLTTSKEEQDLIRSYALGANSYVRKPVDFTQFLDATRQLSLYWLVLNEPPPIHDGG